MTTYRVKSFEAVLRAHAHPKTGIAASFQRGIIDGARRGKAHLVRQSRHIVDLGEFWNSWFDPSSKGSTITLRNDAPHAGIIERGARPHNVSEEGQLALLDWVLRNVHLGRNQGVKAVAATRQAKRIVAGTSTLKTAGKAYGRANDILAEALAVVAGIVRKYRREGQKGHFIVEKALPELKKLAMDEAERAVRKAMEVPEARA